MMDVFFIKHIKCKEVRIVENDLSNYNNFRNKISHEPIIIKIKTPVYYIQ